MDTYPPTHPLMEPDRPPGGTRRSGAKTPRKVQWLDPEEGASEASTRALDEYGVNLEPFETLKDALERHRSLPSLPYDAPTHRPHTASRADSSSPESPTLDPAPTHDVPGESYIDENETAGLPGTDLEAYSQQRASEVVQAHKHGFFSRRFGLGARKRRAGHARADRRDDVEMVAGSSSSSAATVRPGAGVLSTLLTLYEHERASSASGFSTPARSSFDESRATSLYESPTRDSFAPSGFPGGGGGASHDRAQAQSAPSSPPQTPTALKSPGHHHRSWKDSLPFVGEKRPASARNSAGVIGALIASTGNLSGAAAPTNSTLAPALKRPGYHLSRYSWDASAGASVPRPESSVSRDRDLRRPQSMHLPMASGSGSGSSSSSPLPLPGTPFAATPGGGGGSASSPMLAGTPESSTPPSPSAHRQSWTGLLKDLPRRGWTRMSTPTPTASTSGTPTADLDAWLVEKDRDGGAGSEKDEKRHRERRRRRKKAEIYITRHVAEIIQRQEFICKLARAMMMFGGPSHRLQAQIQATARVLDVSLACMYLPDMMLLSFDDAATGTSNLKLVRQGGAFDIAKLQAAYKLYWQVIHDDISVKDASVRLDGLMTGPPLYNKWQLIFFGGMCSASICSVSFSGSFVDCLVAFPLGCVLIVIQLFAAKHELYSNVFEITVATLFSFISAALATSGHFCYSAVAASSVVLILPGYIVLCGIVELSSHNLVSGAVRVCFSIIYSLFLGFGLAIGATAFSKMTGYQLRGQDDITCALTHHADGPWYQRTPSVKWAFLSVPMYSLWLSLRFYAPWNRKELPLLVAISCLGWATNHFTGRKFPGQNDVSSAAGALVVGFVSNLYARFFKGNAFVIMITAILFQLPSGVANGGLFTFVSKSDAGQAANDVYLSGFQTALQLVSVALGLTVGLGISLVLVFPIQPRRRAAGIFSL